MMSLRKPLALGLWMCAALHFGPASAQDAPSLADITEAWLVSPHGDRTSEAFIHWNEDSEIPGTCAVCHSSIGVTSFLRGPMTEAAVIDHPVGVGTTVDCVACHSAAALNIGAVPFPSGVTIDSFGASAVCTVCHQGRASTLTVAKATDGLEDDALAGDLAFINVHYAPSASTILGGVAQGGFEYPGKTYVGQFAHVPDFDSCTDCHSPHSLQVDLNSCTACHQGVADFADIRITPTDFDGDGDVTEGIANPIGTLHAALGGAIQAYGKDIAQTPVAYAKDSYPYFFVDTDGDGAASADEAAFANRFQSWTPRMLRAAYNYQLIAKEPGIHAHNPKYALQLLYDSLEDLSNKVDVDMTGLLRP